MMGEGAGEERGHESTRSRSHIGGQRLSLRPADGQPSPFYRHCPRKDSTRHGFGKGERRRHEADTRVHQATVRSKEARVSISLGTHRHWGGGLEDEPTKSTIVATKAFPARQDGHLDTHMPRRSAAQKTPLFLSWQVLNAFQVEFDAGRQRLLRIVKGCAVGCDVEVGTDRMPLPARLSRITSQREVHDQLPRFKPRGYCET